jgi:hypothetical protein
MRDARAKNPRPETPEERRHCSYEYAQQKYEELNRMLAIPEGARIIVPKLDEMGAEDGFVLARAARAKSGKGPVCECYRFDRSPTPFGDYKHIVAVDPKSVKIIAKDESNLSRQIHEELGPRRSPVSRSVNKAFNEQVEKVFLAHSGDLDAPTPRPASEIDEKKARKKLKADISRRQGSGKFRQDVLDAFARKCAITDCDTEDALEAAHIRTYQGSDDNSLYNGILLRADIHTLFDLGYICVRTTTNRVAISKKLAGTVYQKFHGKPVRMPPFADKGKVWKKSLDHHRRLFV